MLYIYQTRAKIQDNFIENIQRDIKKWVSIILFCVVDIQIF